MKLINLIGRVLGVVLVLAFIYGIHYCWISFPISNGYGAKVLCSAVFVSGRDPKDVIQKDVAFFPIRLGTFQVDYTDSSVTCSLWGLGKRKAIYRHGLGATLVSELTEQEIRKQPIHITMAPHINTDTIPWPMGDKVVGAFPKGVDSIALYAAIDSLFTERDTDHLVQTRAVAVVYNGQLIAERYAPGYHKNTPLIGWSMTKSITNALVGILVKQHLLHVDEPAPVPEWQSAGDPRHAITLKHLLQQSSGLDFDEEYAKSADATKMLFQRADMAAFTASHPLKEPPGSHFYYSSGNSNILSRIIRQKLGDDAYYTFPYQQLFYKIGMYSAVLEPDASGTFVGSSYCYATARDWARFGLLYLNDGVYNGERILPVNWVKESTTPASSATKGQYGYQFWLNAGEKNNPANRTYPHAPTDMFCADGYEGQNIFIIPSKKLVVVRLGLTRDGQYGADEFLSHLIAAIHE